MQGNNDLTAADWRLMQALNHGLSNKDMALSLCKSEFTIRNQLSSLYKKISVTNRTHAAYWYREHVAQAAKSRSPDFVERRNRAVNDRRKETRQVASESGEVQSTPPLRTV